MHQDVGTSVNNFFTKHLTSAFEQLVFAPAKTHKVMRSGDSGISVALLDDLPFQEASLPPLIVLAEKYNSN